MSRAFTRRQALRTAAATLWLPWLPSLAPRSAWGAAPDIPKRLLVYHVANGLNVGDPGQAADNVDPGGVLAPLDPLAKRMSVVTGLRNRAVDAMSDHEPCTPSLLSDKAPTRYFNGPFDCGITCDQFAAQQIGGETPFPSLQLGAATRFEPISPHGRTYSARLSWASPTVPMPPTEVPRQLFDRMFGGSDDGLTKEERERRRVMRSSVLDSVLGNVGSLEGRLNSADRVKLDQYTTSVRELELRIQALEDQVCPTPEAPPSNLPLKDTIEAMRDLMVIALQCDYTRVLTFMSSPSSSYAVYDWLGVTEQHHTVSHTYEKSQRMRDALYAIQTWHSEIMLDLVSQLEAVPSDDGGDLLSHTLVVYTSEFTEPNAHDSHPLPFVLFGGEAGGVRQGRQLAVQGGTSHANLLRSFIRYTGADPEGFGPNATGEVDLSL